jgi:hypothetical protein
MIQTLTREIPYSRPKRHKNRAKVTKEKKKKELLAAPRIHYKRLANSYGVAEGAAST